MINTDKSTFAGKLVTYPGPVGEPASQDYTSTVNGEPVFCYTSYRYDFDNPTETIQGRAVSPVSFLYFDFEGEVTIRISTAKEFSSVIIRPLSLNIEPDLGNRTICFNIKEPGFYIIEPYGTQRPLHIFANPIETDVPDFNDEKVHYFGPGIHYIDPFELNDGETVYIAGGAVVYANIHEVTSQWSDMDFQRGTFYAVGKKNIRIMGRGIICGRATLEKEARRHRLIEATKCSNISVEGVILRESSGWTFAVFESQVIKVNNVKIIGHYVNNDGIDICSSRDVLVENCFCHNADDSFLIKAHDAPVNNVTFRNCIVWNDVATSFGIINETAFEVSNVLFRDCIVVHSTLACWIPDACGVLGVWNDRGGPVRDVVFENIVVEDACSDKQAIKLNITDLENLGKLEGTVKNITFRNIEFINTNDERITLSSPFHEGAIANISFENVSINGKNIKSVSDSNFVIEGVSNVKIKYKNS